MIDPRELDVIKDKVMYTTSDEKFVVYENDQRVVKSTEYKMLGFLNDHIYGKEGRYLTRSTLSGKEICRIYLDIDHAVFKEKFPYAYFYKDKTVHKVNEYMEIEWSLVFDDYIRSITIDNYGSIYILFENSCTIKRYSNEGDYIFYLNNGDDGSKDGRLYNLFVNEGCGHAYVIGSYFYDNKCTSFIDHYNTRTCKLIEHLELFTYKNVKKDDEFFTYRNIHVDGDFIYIYANNYIEKINIAGRQIWRYTLGYNYLTDSNDHLVEVAFDDKMFNERIYFCESLDSSNGYSVGKLSTNGNLIWKLINPEGVENADFNICVYKDIMYLTGRHEISAHKSYILAVDNNNMLFETRDNNLIRAVIYNYEELYDKENYIGRYLLANELKEGVEKFITNVLDCNTGHIKLKETDESRDYYVYLRSKDKNLLDNSDNYNYFKLLAFEELGEAPNALSRIVTKDGNYLTTMNGSYIDTLFPYIPDVTYQYIVKPDGTILTTDDNEKIVRNRGIYTQWFYLLADEYMFAQDIVTKREEDTIITKKKGFSIIRKQRKVWRYITRTLIDTDILVEHLMQNGILETMIPDYVDRLRHHTTHMIKDMQLAHTPTYFDMGAIRRFSYKYDAYDYPLRISNTMIYMCKNIPYIKRDFVKDKIFIKPMSQLVSEEVVTPFIIFIDGKAIKWSNITIIKDWQFSYILISNCKNKVDKFETIVFPCYIRYGENNNILDKEIPSLYFDNEGMLTNDRDSISMRLEIIDKDVIENTQDLNADKYIKVNTRDYDQLSAFNNIFIFENGQLFGSSRLYLDYYGKNNYTYVRPNQGCICKSFYFDKANDSKSMLFDIPNQELVESNIVDKIGDDKSIPSDYFMSPFDFKLSKDKTYLRNISEATRYILTYNMSLLVDYYRDQSNIKSFTFTGESIILLSEQTGGLLYMPRQHSESCFDFIIMFVNDKLYKYYKEIEYDMNQFVIPIFTHIKNEDKVEIVHFKNVYNDYASLIVHKGESDYLASELRYDDFLLFGNSPSGKSVYDTFDVESCDQYPIEFEYRNIQNKNGRYTGTEISLIDPYYLDKPINVVSKRQFHFMYYNVIKPKQSSFDLEPEFRFCHNKNQYMIFVNGLRLNFDEWQLNAMSNSNVRERITITTTMELKRHDNIEIFYIPDTYEEIILENHLSKYGDIILDTSDLEYSFDNELFLIFIDGKKINKDDIQNISMNRVRIKTKYPVNSNITICKYLHPDKLLEKIFSYGDEWSSSIESITEKDYNNLFVKLGLK